MSDYFKNMVKELNDENTHLLSDGSNSAEFTGWIDTGSFILNALVSGSLYGGVPKGRITGFADTIQLTHLKIQQVMNRMVPDGVYLDADGLAEIDLGNGTNYNPQEKKVAK